jgi:hypothetical protein
MDCSDLLKDSPFRRQVWYAWNPAIMTYTFFVSEEFRRLQPVAMFSPLGTEGITFDPELVCDAIADCISCAPPDEEWEL